MGRLVLSARLKPGSRTRAAERHGVFVLEGTDAEYLVRHIVNDPVRSAGFSTWGPLLDGRPTIARESRFWSRDRGARR